MSGKRSTGSTSAATKKQLFISASRVETFQNCSALYSARYIWKLPDTGNDGSRRGSVAHETLEILANPRHRHIYDAAILHNSCKEVPALWRTIQRIARRFQVADKANLDMINDFILVALKHEFFGPPGTFEILTEVPFEIIIDRGDGRKYAARGFIDKAFKVRDKWGLLLSTRDFKGSKDQFDGDKLSFNVQSWIYQLAEREIFPEFKRRDFHFLFLRFPKSPRQNQPSFTDAELDGFEWILTDLQTAMENFTLEQAGSNLAADKPDYNWLCGREGIKKDGKPMFICAARKARDYWVTVDKSGEIVASAFTEAELKPEKEQKIEKRRYPGCPAFAARKSGLSGGLR